MKKELLYGAAIAVLNIGFAQSVMADDFNVSTVDALHDAVSTAKNGDVIKIAAGTYKLEKEIDVTGENKTLTFVGVGKVVLDGQGQTRVMNVHAKASAVVENLIIQNGYVNNSDNNKGAGIRLDEGSLTVTNCKFINNKVDYKASSANWTGGAGIHSHKGQLTITNSEFTGGEAYMGGAIALHNSSIDAKNVLFIGNRTKFEGFSNSAGGGALLVRTDNGDNVYTQNFVNCVFKENVSWGNGGAILNKVGGGAKGQKTVFRGCSFVRNTTNLDIDNPTRSADNMNLHGGAIYFEGDGNVTMDFLCCTITQNWSTLGGGAAKFESFKAKADNELRFVNCTITGNHNLDNCGNGAGLMLNAINTCKGLKIYNTILTGNWSIKVNDDTYADDVDKAEGWRHWEYSDLITGNEANQSLFEIDKTVIGYLNNGEKYANATVGDIKIIHQDSQAWVEGETEEAQLGELAAFDEKHFVYPFNISAGDWMEFGSADLAVASGCTTDQLGDEWESNCIGAVQTDVSSIDYYDVPTFFNEEYVSTGIENIKNEIVTGAENNAWYTVSGVRVAQPAAKGIYIYNGKKVVK